MSRQIAQQIHVALKERARRHGGAEAIARAHVATTRRVVAVLVPAQARSLLDQRRDRGVIFAEVHCSPIKAS